LAKIDKTFSTLEYITNIYLNITRSKRYKNPQNYLNIYYENIQIWSIKNKYK